MKKIIYSIVAMFGLFSATSCEDMLMTDNDSMVIDPSLDSKTDSVFYALGIAQAMQQVADQYFFIGEMRGELVKPTVSTNRSLRELANYSATSSNKYDSAYVYYKVINNCNYYLTHRDTTLYVGGENVTINEYAAVEAWRAWAYLQLARTYGGNERAIPFYTEPLTAISQINEENFPKKTLKEIVEELAPSLEKFSGLQVPNLGNVSYNAGTTNWGSTKYINMQKIFVPVDVILGEMYLENGEWLKAAQHYSKYLCDNKLLAENLGAGMRNYSTVLTSEYLPNDFGYTYNDLPMNYNSIFENVASPEDVLTYIPMAVSSQRGQTTQVPLAFGYDYYSTDASRVCPRAEEIQLAPSEAYFALTDTCDFYYYPANYSGSTELGYPDTVKVCKLGDGRANYADGSGRFNSLDRAILNRNAIDTTKVYIAKAKNANIYLFRTTTIYLHLAEAINRLGHPDAAFAILRNGISTYLEELVPGYGEVTAPYQYMTQESVDLLTNELLFLNVENRNYFLPEVVYGIHHHGAGTSNGKELEDGMTVRGSQATAVGSPSNHSYLPDVIIGAKMQELKKKFNIEVGATKADSINAMEDLLCDEYAKEFAFEGIRFYDLQRIARHKNESGIYGGNFGSLWMADKLRGNNPQMDLTIPANWYLPFK